MDYNYKHHVLEDTTANIETKRTSFAFAAYGIATLPAIGDQYSNNLSTFQIESISVTVFEFVVSGISILPVAGDQYTNNGSTFQLTSVSPTLLVAQRIAGTNNPFGAGTLVRATGSGDDPITFSSRNILNEIKTRRTSGTNNPIAPGNLVRISGSGDNPIGYSAVVGIYNKKFIYATDTEVLTYLTNEPGPYTQSIRLISEKANVALINPLTINPSALTAPLVIGANGQGQFVTGLNADQLDSQEGSYYRNASNLNAGTVPAAQFDDTSHGNRSGGTLHPQVTNLLAGFVPVVGVTTGSVLISTGTTSVWSTILTVGANTCIVTNNLEVVGNIGVGTLNPQAKLHVEGDIVAKSDGTSNLGSATRKFANLYLASAINYSSDLNFVSGTTKVTIGTTGKVGIGITPQTLFHVGVGTTRLDGDLTSDGSEVSLIGDTSQLALGSAGAYLSAYNDNTYVSVSSSGMSFLAIGSGIDMVAGSAEIDISSSTGLYLTPGGTSAISVSTTAMSLTVGSSATQIAISTSSLGLGSGITIKPGLVGIGTVNPQQNIHLYAGTGTAAVTGNFSVTTIGSSIIRTKIDSTPGILVNPNILIAGGPTTPATVLIGTETYPSFITGGQNGRCALVVGNGTTSRFLVETNTGFITIGTDACQINPFTIRLPDYSGALCFIDLSNVNDSISTIFNVTNSTGLGQLKYSTDLFLFSKKLQATELKCSAGTSIAEFSIDGTLGGNADNALPTEKAVKTYVDTAVVGVSSNGWTRLAPNVYLTIGTDNVGIGTNNALTNKLYVYGGDIVGKNNLGVGTSLTSSPLEIYDYVTGYQTLKSNYSGGANLYLGVGTAFQTLYFGNLDGVIAYNGTSDSMLFKTTNLTRMTIGVDTTTFATDLVLTNHNLGVGTSGSTTSAPLEIWDSASNYQTLKSNYGGGFASLYVGVGTNSHNIYLGSNLAIQHSSAANLIYFKINNNIVQTLGVDTTTFATDIVLTNHNLGVGTSGSTTSAPLEIWDWATNYQCLKTTFGGGFANLYVGAGTNQQNIYFGANVAIQHSSAANLMYLRVNNNTEFTIGVNTCIAAGNFQVVGNTGLGTTNPQAKLHVEGDIVGIASTSNLGSATRRWANLYMASNIDYASNLSFNSTTTKAVLTTTGFLGIGTSATASSLEVWDTISGKQTLKSNFGAGAASLYVGAGTSLGNLYFGTNDGVIQYNGIADSMIFKTNNATKFTIGLNTAIVANDLVITGNNLGVATSYALMPLDVYDFVTHYSTLRSNYGAGQANLYIGLGTNQQAIHFGTNDGMIQYNGVADTMLLKTGNLTQFTVGLNTCSTTNDLVVLGSNLGVATSYPMMPLDIYDFVTKYSCLRTNYSSGANVWIGLGTSQQTLYFGTNDGVIQYNGIANTMLLKTNNLTQFTIGVNTCSTTNDLVVLGSNLGVATNYPMMPLDVYDFVTKYSTLRSNYGAGQANLYIGLGTNQQAIHFGTNDGMIQYNGVADTMLLKTNNLTQFTIGVNTCSTTNDLVVLGSNLGVATSYALMPLDVYDSVTKYSCLRTNYSSGANMWLGLGTSLQTLYFGTNDGVIQYSGIANTMLLKTNNLTQFTVGLNTCSTTNDLVVLGSNLGVATNYPMMPLDIYDFVTKYSTLRSNYGAGQANLYIGLGTNQQAIHFGTNDGMIQYNGVADSMLLKTNNLTQFTIGVNTCSTTNDLVVLGSNLGVATNYPLMPLDVYDNVTKYNCLRTNYSSGANMWLGLGTSLQTLYFGTNDGVIQYSGVVNQMLLKTNNITQLTLGVNTCITRNDLQVNGNIGIGTANPQSDLHVEGNIVGKDDDTSNLGSATRRWANVYMASTIDYAGTLNFVSGGSTSISCASTGRISIGTTDSDTKLEVSGPRGAGFRGQLIVTGLNDHAYLQVRTTDPTTKETGLQFVGNELITNPEWTLRIPANSNDFQFRHNTSGVAIGITSSGYVGIRTATASAPLEIWADWSGTNYQTVRILQTAGNSPALRVGSDTTYTDVGNGNISIGVGTTPSASPYIGFASATDKIQYGTSPLENIGIYLNSSLEFYVGVNTAVAQSDFRVNGNYFAGATVGITTSLQVSTPAGNRTLSWTKGLLTGVA